MKDIREVAKYVKDQVSLGQKLREEGHDVHLYGEEEQFSCPFHGRDSKPSARYYPQSDSVHCFTCHETWDILGYTMQKQDMSFVPAVNWLVSSNSLNISHLPDVSETIQKLDIDRGKDADTLAKKKIILLVARIEEEVRALRKKIPWESYGKLVFILANLRKMEQGREFIETAKAITGALKRVA